MIAIATYEFIYLLPLIILSCAILILLLVVAIFRISTKISFIFTITCLIFAFISSSLICYKINSNSDQIILSSGNLTQNIDTGDTGTNQTTDITSDIAKAATETEAFHEIGPFQPQAIQQPQTIQQTTNDEPEKDNSKSWQASYVTILFTGDGYGTLYTSLILFLSILVSTLAFQWFKNEKNNHSLFYLIILFSALGATTLIYSSHLVSFFVSVEMLSLAIVGLIGYQYTQKYSLEAAIKYLVLSVISSTFLLLGIAFYYAATGELTFSGLSFQLSTIAVPSPLLLLGVCLMLVGIGFKLSFVPFQLWLPDVYQGAPASICLLLTTVGKVAIFCAVARLFLLAPIVNNETIRIIMILMSFCSIIWGNIFSITQHNIKRLLAYSSITHFGYLLIALIAVQYQVLALETIGVYLIGYILANICVLGVISLESHSNDIQDQENDIDLCGLFWRRPIITLAMGVGLLSLAGIPLTVGFIGRFSLILLGVTAELWWLVGLMVIGSAFSLYFYLRLVINLYLKPIETAETENLMLSTTAFKVKRISINEVFIVISALLILLCGIYPKWLFSLVSIAQYLMPQ